MTLLVLPATALIVAFAALCAIGASRFVRLARAPTQLDPPTAFPRCAVLLALRGSDWHLAECVSSLCRQDYPSYQVHITIDAEDDAAARIVHAVLRTERPAHVQLSLLHERFPTCSLKNSALLQMLSALDHGVEVIAIVDGDVVPHATWLRELVTPLTEPGIGATFGVPWHVSTRATWGSLLRSQWWMFGALMMVLRGWPWGGTCALRVDTLRRAGIDQRWRTSLSTDTPLHDALARLRLRARWAPSLIMVIRDECSVRSFFPQLVRYLLVRRLYLPHWQRERILGSALGAALLINIGALATSVWTGDWRIAAIAGGALVLHSGVLTAVMFAIDASARSSLRRRSVEVPRWTSVGLLRALLCVPALFPLITAAALAAEHTRSVTWRGVRYGIRGSTVSLDADGAAAAPDEL